VALAITTCGELPLLGGLHCVVQKLRQNVLSMTALLAGLLVVGKTMADGPSPTLAPTPGTRCLTLCDNHQI